MTDKKLRFFNHNDHLLNHHIYQKGFIFLTKKKGFKSYIYQKGFRFRTKKMI
jgi:hypothetical protein